MARETTSSPQTRTMRPYSLSVRKRGTDKKKKPQPPGLGSAIRRTGRGVRSVVKGAGRVAGTAPALVRAYRGVRKTRKGAKNVRRGGREAGNAIRSAPKRIARKVRKSIRR